jgi:hypothetical protein
LDIFQGSVDPANQIHDYNPSESSSGLFWTLPVNRNSVRVDVGDGRASMSLHNYGIQDFGNLANALHHGSSEQTNISFDLRWFRVLERVTEVNEEQGYRARLTHTNARIQWKAVQSGFRFASDPASRSTNVFSQIGQERNGVFFET